MKKMFSLFLIGTFAVTTVTNAQTSDTAKLPNGQTIIVNIGNKPGPKKQQKPNGQQLTPPQAPSTEKQPLEVYVNVEPPATKSFLSNEGIVFAILLAVLFTAVFYRRYHHGEPGYWYYNENGRMVHSGNIDHTGNMNHSGVVTHKHVHETPVAQPAAAASAVAAPEASAKSADQKQ